MAMNHRIPLQVEEILPIILASTFILPVGRTRPEEGQATSQLVCEGIAELQPFDFQSVTFL